MSGTTLTTNGGRKFEYCVVGQTLTLGLADGTTATFTAGDPTPRPEICDGRDNDLDGTIDDDPVECPPAGTCLTAGVCATSAVPTCGGGRWSCKYTSPAYEVVEKRCDQLDNDCDGMVDELPECREVCDGKDNDGSGVADDNLTDTPPTCERLGVCASGGRAVCRGTAGWTCEYPDPAYEALESRCDGLDNDCDGRVDEVCPRCSSTSTLAMLWGVAGPPATASVCFASPDGTGTPARVDNLPPGLRTPAVIDRGKLYFTTVDPLAIRRVSLDGTGLELVHTPAAFPWSVDLDDTGQWLYFSDPGGKEVRRLDLATKKEEIVAQGIVAYDLRVEGAQMYYQDDPNGPVVRSNLDGTGVIRLTRHIVTSGWDVDLVNNRLVYHSNGGKLHVADLRGQNEKEIFDPPNTVWRIRSDPWSGWVYYLSNFSTHRIRPDGTGAQVVPFSCAGMRELSAFAIGGCTPP